MLLGRWVLHPGSPRSPSPATAAVWAFDLQNTPAKHWEDKASPNTYNGAAKREQSFSLGATKAMLKDIEVVSKMLPPPKG